MLISKLYALFLEFDVIIIIKFIMIQIFFDSSQKKISLFIYINSKSLYDCLIKLKTTQKKRLIINIFYLRQFYERREIIEIL